ncbi:MAG: hypothetical protein XE08_0802 [Parcubacteria bacterium 32_520]|nr:MAG: hypothetical protein XE08_0802 [Parcubacteria bacterium 32_520]
MLLALIRTFLVLIVGTFSGYLAQKLINKNQWLNPESLKQLAIFLQKLGMIWLISITYVGSLWIFEMENLIEWGKKDMPWYLSILF